jgi:hypothetical protein
MTATTTTTTGRLEAELRMEGQTYTAPEGSGAPDRTLYRPHGVYLQNDGVWHYWIERDREYELHHDDLGWVVGCTSWPPSVHTYRLALGGGFTTRLPLADGSAPLNPAAKYTIRGDGARWVLREH